MLFNLLFVQYKVKKPNYTISTISTPISIKKYRAEPANINNRHFICFATNLDLTGKSVEELANTQLVPNNFFRNFFNSCWQQEVFLSAPTAISEKYASRLKSQNIVSGKTYQKHFIHQFGKALITGRISASITKSSSDTSLLSISPCVKYIWRKGINIKIPTNFKSIISNITNNIGQNKASKHFLSKLNLHKLPLFVLINDFGQMIITEPPDELNFNKTIPDLLYHWYDNSILHQSSNKPVYEGWFFVNSQEAEEYCEYVKQRYPLSQSYKNLRVFASNLETFYKLSRKGYKKVHFHLVPDLSEVGKLVTKYKNYNNIKFSEKQNRGKDYFQGQPIYLIQDGYDKDENEPIKYYYRSSQYGKTTQYQAIFTNYQTAIKAWKVFIKHTPYHKLSGKPNLIVYNLEDFLKDQENIISSTRYPFLFVPSENVYRFIKVDPSHNTKNMLLSMGISYTKLWIQRIFWSLTSRQPYNW
uniref:Uncharacterized protein n=1 Tax=Renouxia sp. TaxID=2485823 RepID=A0A3G3MHM4_9FLOR|nr:hypothetical protein [Renouxia sp.]